MTLRHYDESTFKRRLEDVLSANKLWGRMFRRGGLKSGIKPPVPLIWGGTLIGYRFWWFAPFLACLFFLSALDCWANSHGRPSPGGALLLPIAILFGGPVIAVIRRKRVIKSSGPTDPAAFAAGIRGTAPAVPERFAQAAREALAAAYCIPVKLIGSLDTRRRIMALSALNQPLAIEVIADLCRREGIPWNYERMYAAARPFKKLRPANAAELVRMLHREMQSAELL